jgi:hypothetical protein
MDNKSQSKEEVVSKKRYRFDFAQKKFIEIK